MLSIHMMLASMTGIPEFTLHASEAHEIAQAAEKVLEQYEVVLSPRTLAWWNLSVVVGGMYSTRFVAYQLRRDVERRAKAGQLGPVAVPRSQQQQQPAAGT